MTKLVFIDGWVTSRRLTESESSFVRPIDPL